MLYKLSKPKVFSKYLDKIHMYCVQYKLSRFSIFWQLNISLKKIISISDFYVMYNIIQNYWL